MCVCVCVLQLFSNQSYLIQKSYLIEIKLRVFTQPFFLYKMENVSIFIVLIFFL